ICPLCCEELDLSDKQFYPCKCGYQVCMWCWHRIKESESGLCPACRTPYGDDPHEFSAVDMEEVVKANKEKALAEKRERERLRAMREQEKREQLANYANPIGAAPSSGGGGSNFAGALVSGGLGGGGGGSSSFGQFDGADLVAALGSGASSSTQHRGPPEPPKDRSTLATMRVIRRNLVYAVGMPPNIATEENLRKPEYFGQYGKISKIVINRNHNPGDPRRASASAYVTFAHKEDTLACILALDGFYHDGRNIRASYGTSKYCSAFIKNVRCNNPDCTYLHHMGDAEDTFTKQEIQAGYVTSGRDVLARQQQIMAQQAAAVFGAGGGPGRRKVGGGGPSGTGKASASPVFPPPTFDEPLPKKVMRSQSAILQQRAMQHHSALSGQHGMGGGAGAPSAASIVAGIGTAPAAPPAPHTTLTPLTPLKRAGSMPLTGKSAAAVTATSGTGGIPTAPSSGGIPKSSQPLVGGSSDLTPAESLALQEQRKEAALAQQQQQQREMAMKNANNRKSSSSSTPNSPSHSSVGSSGSRGSKKEIAGTQQQQNGALSAKHNQQPGNSAASGFIRSGSSGGQPTPIGAISGSNLPNMGSPLIGSSFSGNLVSGAGGAGSSPAATSMAGGVGVGRATTPLDLAHTGSGILGGQPLAALSSENGLIGGASLGGNNPFGGLGLLSSAADSSAAAGGVDKWGAAGGGQNNMFGGSGALWGGNNDPNNKPAPIGPANGRGISNSAPGGDVGGMSLFGTNNQNGFPGSGSSALANMLGIELPTGSGSLREFGMPQQQQAPVGAVGAIGGPVGAIGANKPNNNNGMHMMMQPIGSPAQGGGVPIGGYGNHNDVALLQSLLPGVNITSGNAHLPAAPQYHNQQQPVGVASLNQAQWNQGNTPGSAQQQQDQQQAQRSGNAIW
ncbi:hypothetical protein ACHAXR_013302, partial [Thalassiosira sp. AJA248-18]